MSDTGRPVSIPSDSRLDPNQASVTLSWRITETDGRTKVEDVTLDPKDAVVNSNIQRMLEQLGTVLVPGLYSMCVTEPSKACSFLIPADMPSGWRKRCQNVLQPWLQRCQRDLQNLLGQCPTDDQIEAAARHLAVCGLHSLIRPTPNSNGGSVFPDVSGIRPGFIQIGSVDCAGCGRASFELESVSSIDELARILFEIERSTRPTITFGEHGRVFMECTDRKVTAHIGFATHKQPFAKSVNALLAQRFRAFYETVEKAAMVEALKTDHDTVMQFADVLRQIARAFGTTIPLPTAEEPSIRGDGSDGDHDAGAEASDDPAYADAGGRTPVPA